MMIKIAILGFIGLVLLRVVARFRSGRMTSRELLVWAFFWLLVAGATIRPQVTDRFAQWLGVERGADLLVYVSVLALFFLVFKLIGQVHDTEEEVTRLVRELALQEKSENRK